MSRAKPKSTTRSVGKRPSITDLYKEFETACAAARAVPPPKPPSVSSKAFDRAIGKCGAIADRIVIAAANSVEEMLLKIRVAGWCVDAPEDLAKLEHWMPTGCGGEELEALVSLREDLHRLCQAGFVALNKRFDHKEA